MGNDVSFKSKERNIDKCFYMSNTLTTVSISVLALSGSYFAKSIREKEIVMWLSEHDYAVCGLGTYGFEITEIPWVREFVLKIIDGALKKVGWELLDYEPFEEGVFKALNEFKNLILMIESIDVIESEYCEWKGYGDINPILKPPEGFPKCLKHGVYLHFGGCVICNDK
ncbi:MAG: hypothetical protein H7Y18_03980 [Clostridiaceae bacterium]|nr:hypothetical protein [Clostridiaceae bacterium]